MIRGFVMNFKNYLILAGALILIVLIVPVSQGQEPKTDLKIITRLDSGGFLTPALSENQTFVYSNFEFYLYTNINNTGYTIIVDNLTIANKTIDHFMDLFTWKTSKTYIDRLEVFIGASYWEYSNIFVFSYSVTNRSFIRDEELITFTPSELDNFIQEIKLRASFDTFMGFLFCLIFAYVVVRHYKKDHIKRIA